MTDPTPYTDDDVKQMQADAEPTGLSDLPLTASLARRLLDAGYRKVTPDTPPEPQERFYVSKVGVHSSTCEEGPNHPGPCHPMPQDDGPEMMQGIWPKEQGTATVAIEDVAQDERWWLCPNRECEHGSVLHDAEDYDDLRPTCCVDGCPCGHKPPAEKELPDQMHLDAVIAERDHAVTQLNEALAGVERLTAELAEANQMRNIITELAQDRERWRTEAINSRAFPVVDPQDDGPPAGHIAHCMGENDPHPDCPAEHAVAGGRAQDDGPTEPPSDINSGDQCPHVTDGNNPLPCPPPCHGSHNCVRQAMTPTEPQTSMIRELRQDGTLDLDERGQRPTAPLTATVVSRNRWSVIVANDDVDFPSLPFLAVNQQVDVYPHGQRPTDTPAGRYAPSGEYLAPHQFWVDGNLYNGDVIIREWRAYQRQAERREAERREAEPSDTPTSNQPVTAEMVTAALKAADYWVTDDNGMDVANLTDALNVQLGFSPQQPTEAE